MFKWTKLIKKFLISLKKKKKKVHVHLIFSKNTCVHKTCKLSISVTDAKHADIFINYFLISFIAYIDASWSVRILGTSLKSSVPLSQYLPFWIGNNQHQSCIIHMQFFCFGYKQLTYSSPKKIGMLPSSYSMNFRHQAIWNCQTITTNKKYMAFSIAIKDTK